MFKVSKNTARSSLLAKYYYATILQIFFQQQKATLADWDTIGRVVTQTCGRAFKTLSRVFQTLRRAFQTLGLAFDFLL